MLMRMASVLFFGYLVQLLCVPLHLDQTGRQMTTEYEAVSILRSRGSSAPGDEFVVVRKLEPTPSTLHAAQQSLQEAQSLHLDLYSNGVLVNLMRAGGFVILEYDRKSDRATRLHLVTLDEAGRAFVKSENVDGDLGRSEALMILDRSAQFSEAFFSSPSSDLGQILRKFGGTGTSTLGIPDGQGYLAIPEAVKKLTRRPEELSELTSLSSAVQLWTIRCALAMPVYAANPVAAVQKSSNKLSGLAQEFLAEKGEKGGLDSIDHLVDLDSIQTHDEFTMRLQRLKELNSFLDKHFPLRLDSAAYKANASICVIPLNLGVMGQDGDHAYGVMTAPGLISIWKHAESGEFVLRGLSVGE
jgi:hypothetical protein